MSVSGRHAVGLLVLWLFLVVVSLTSRSFIPIDETRYVTVAWEMWLRGDFLVPHLNGEPYSHKPPLLFWLMNAGWAVLGVNAWWPRLAPSFFALGGAFILMRIARILWPGQEAVARMASVILFGCLLWMVFATATMFDMLIAFFTLIGMLGLVTAGQGSSRTGWGLVGFAIGMGLLAKGPIILLQILPAAVLAPWWAKGSAHPLPRTWFAGLLGALLLGIALALAWAIPAGIHGGEAYQHAIFWGQTADRVVKSFAHQRPLWWYLPVLPVLLFPWLLYGGVWRGLARLTYKTDSGVRFCLAWSVPVFFAFCLISGKQVHYLLPLFPAFSLLAARGLGMLDSVPGPLSRLAVGVAILGVGAVVLMVPQIAVQAGLPPWAGHIPVASGITLLLVGGAFLCWGRPPVEKQVWLLASTSLALVLGLYWALIRTAGPAYDVRPISQHIKALQDAGISLANTGKYHGQYQFSGRLIRPIPSVPIEQLPAWFDAHPDGRIIFYPEQDRHMPQGHGRADFEQPYLGVKAGIYSREALLPPHAGTAPTAHAP